ncbi:hypothetical protein IFE09_27240 [Streptomyces microflavus]|nr:hypothetical protein [Streptomyces microflavus]QQZ56895.1 hypothetical protein IFE09_27240 [Streptomyces microflavus]
MSAPKDDALARAVAEHGPFPMPVGEPMPVELTEQQLDALSAAGNRALNDHYHEDLCYCRSWPTSCVSSGGYFMGTWDTSAFDIGLPAVLGVWESLRNDRHAAKIAELRADNAALRVRVAELEAARTTAAADRDKQIIAWLEQKAAEYGTSNRERRAKAEAVDRMADKLSRGAVRPACPPVSPEDPHDSPLHHEYAVGRDLPEATPEPPAVTVDRWNAQYPVGTSVFAYPGCRPEDDPKCTQLTTRTRSAASVLGGHTAVVWVDGHSACISLTHVDPRHETGGAL